MRALGLVSRFLANVHLHLGVVLAHIAALIGRLVGVRQLLDPVESGRLEKFKRLKPGDLLVVVRPGPRFSSFPFGRCALLI